MRLATSSISSRRFFGIQLRSALAVELGPLGGEVQRHLREVVGDDLTRRHVHDRRDGDALRIVGDAVVVRVAQVVNLQYRVDAAGVQVERPAALVVRRPAKANRQNVFQAEQASHDDRAVRPRAGPRDDQPVAVRLDGIAVAAVGRDARGDVVGVAVELAAAGDICHRSSLHVETALTQEKAAIFMQKFRFATEPIEM